MTYSPAMKFHGFISKLFFYPFFLMFILSSCASLNTSVQTYNLEGKLSYVSDEISAIFSIKIFSYEENLQILLLDPINGDLIENLQGSRKYWNKINIKNIDLMESLPEPSQIPKFLKDKIVSLAGLYVWIITFPWVWARPARPATW